MANGRCQTGTMIDKAQLKEWIVEALTDLGGSAHHVRVAEAVWGRHEIEIRESGDLFYTWQYDLRWAKQDLQDNGTLIAQPKPRGTWALR